MAMDATASEANVKKNIVNAIMQEWHVVRPVNVRNVLTVNARLISTSILRNKKKRKMLILSDIYLLSFVLHTTLISIFNI